MVQSQSTIEVFCSYAPQDKGSLTQLINQLAPLVQKGLISIWNDQEIPVGSDRAREIEQHLGTAQIILLLISPDFMASKHHQDIEVKRAMERYKDNKARVIPIIVRPCDIQNTPFADLEFLPRDRRPINMHRSIDEAWMNVAKELSQLINKDIPPPHHPPDRRIRPTPRIVAIVLIIAILVVSAGLATFLFVLHNTNQNGNSLSIQKASTPTSGTLTTATGDGYTIGYPSGWTSARTSKKNTVSVVSTLQLSSNASSSTAMLAETVTSPNPVSTTGSVKGALSAVQGQTKNFQTKSVPATVTINNITWDQGATTYDDPLNGGTNFTMYILSTKFPGNANKLVTIIYAAPTSEFDKVNTEDFQPMLLSFKFA